MPNFFFLLKPNNRFTGTFSWINPYRRPFFLIKVVRQSVRGFIRNMSWKRHRLARRRIIAESRPMYAELPVCRARAWALCYASSLPPGATSDKARYVNKRQSPMVILYLANRATPFGKKDPPLPHRNFTYLRYCAMLELHLSAIPCISPTAIP